MFCCYEDSVIACADEAGNLNQKSRAGKIAKIDGTAGTSGTDLVLNTASIVINANVSVSSFTITDGNA